jgi:hypothetical protein
MPTFLPLTADNRSQRVRIARQTIAQFPAVSYINLGQVDPPGTALNQTVTFTAKATVKEKTSIVKGKYYLYAITSVDASGNESQPYIVEVKSGAGAEAENEYNANEFVWTKVPHAVAYKVYGSAVAGGAKEAISQVNLIAEVTTAKYVDEGAARGTATPPETNKTQYNVGGGAFSTRKELQNHLAVGAVLVLGGYTPSNLDYIPRAENSAWELTGFGTGKEEKYEVLEAKEIVQRSTGRINKTVCRTLKVTGFKSEASKEKVALVVYNAGNGQLEKIESANETTVSISTLITEKVKTDQQILYVLRTKGTTKELENLTEEYFGPNAPAIGSAH